MKARFASILALILVLAGVSHAFAAVAAPENIKVVSKSIDTTSSDNALAEVSWTEVPGALGYSVYATNNGVSRSGSVAACAIQKCTSIVSQLTAGVTWSFYVTALKSATEVNTAPAVSFIPQSVPDAVTGATATPGVGRASLIWTAPANSGGLPITSYVISGGPRVVTIDGTATSREITELTAGSKYTFSISAVNSLGTSAPVSFSQVAIPSSPNAPASPTGTASKTSISVSWSAPADGGLPITGYKVLLLDKDSKDLVSTAVAGTSLSATFSNLTIGSYYVQVVATNLAGDSARSSASAKITIVAASAFPNSPIFTPSDLSDMVTGETQGLTVTAPSGGAPSVLGSGACSYASGAITAVGHGVCTISASIAASGAYAEGSAVRTLSVKLPQAILFAAITAKTAGDSILLSASSNSGLSVSFSAAGSCRLTGATLSFTEAGSCQVTASQSGNSTYAPALPAVRSFQITSPNAGGVGGGGGGGGGGPLPVPTLSPKPVTPTAGPVAPIVKPSAPPTANVVTAETKFTLKLTPGSTTLTKQTQSALLSVSKLLKLGKSKSVAIPMSTAKTTLTKAKAQAAAVAKALTKLGLKASVVVSGKGSKTTIKVVARKK